MQTDEELSLVRKAQAGDSDAQQELVDRYERMIYAISGQWKSVNRVELDDMLQEGRIAILVAVKRYKIGHGSKLSSYIRLYIHQYLVDYARQHGRLIRVPQNAIRVYVSSLKVEDDLSQRRTPYTMDDVAKELGVNVSQLEDLRSNIEGADCEYPIHTLPDERHPGYEHVHDEANSKIERAKLRGIIYDLLPTLTSREAEVITRHYGIGVPAEPLAEIAASWKSDPSYPALLHMKAKQKIAAAMAEDQEVQ